MNEIPFLLKCLMEETNMSVAELARRANVSQAMVSRVLSGRSQSTLGGIDKLLAVFGCHVTVRRIQTLTTDFDPETHKHRLSFDDPIEGNPHVQSLRDEKRKTKRP